MKNVVRLTLCVFALLMISILCACGKVEYSAKDFADVKVVGYSDHGTLEISVKQATIDAMIADDKNNKSDVLRFAETFKFDYGSKDDEENFLSNDDEVTINVSYDEELAKNLNIEILDTSFKYTVEGLEDKQEMSPFEGLSVKFSGIAPYGTVQLDKSNCIQYIIDNVTFYCDDYDLSNGDKVVVRAEFNSEMAERSGYIFTEDVKKYTVVGLSKYVKTMAGVSYGEVTAVMRRMVEHYVSPDDEGYKTLDWNFGGDDSDTDEFADDESYDSEDNSEVSEPIYNEDGDLIESSEGDGAENSDYNSNESNTSSKPKKMTDTEKILADFTSASFDASFEYEPVSCYYSLNPVQYTDNIFSSVYKVTGTFVCTETNGTSYINSGDTVVGELYVIASLVGGSVDIKNKLVYEESVLYNYYDHSLRSHGTYEDMYSDIFGETAYLTEILDYIEDEDAYNDFVKKETAPTTSKREVSHISEPSSDSDAKSRVQMRENGSIINQEESESTSSENVSSEYASEYNYYDENDYGYDGEYNDDTYNDDYYYDDQYNYYE